jgi:hypothetical protein
MSFFQQAVRTSEKKYGHPVYFDGSVRAIACSPIDLFEIRESLNPASVIDGMHRLISDQDISAKFPITDLGEFSAGAVFITDDGIVVCRASGKLALKIGIAPWWTLSGATA